MSHQLRFRDGVKAAFPANQLNIASCSRKLGTCMDDRCVGNFISLPYDERKEMELRRHRMERILDVEPMFGLIKLPMLGWR